ncbi:unnamed protein product [Lactuca saligna]|uniref:Bax inhibitor 1 n=1 Tax=Lactuca saligna TaxID=75948 RepID=A0AA36E7B5_LACSI|nr:unnamed protein product [Lactuca saligna]
MLYDLFGFTTSSAYRVYFLLCCALMASVFGVILHMLLNIGGFLTFFATLGCLYSILTSPTHEKKKRVAVLMARRRVFLYLGGFLSSCFSILVWAGFASLIFGDSAALFIIQMYFGLLVFIGYVVVDTQEIIESAHLGNLDYVTDALLLSTDFIAIFVRILIITLEYSSEEKEKKEKKQRK